MPPLNLANIMSFKLIILALKQFKKLDRQMKSTETGEKYIRYSFKK